MMDQYTVVPSAMDVVLKYLVLNLQHWIGLLAMESRFA
jgi:hypothetical protein